MAKKIVYILTNHWMPDLVKIGMTTNLPARLRTLNSGVPRNFDVRYALEIPSDVKLEGIMHEAFSAQRVDPENQSRQPEFFRVPFENAVSAMKLAAKLVDDAKPVGDDHIVEKGRGF